MPRLEDFYEVPPTEIEMVGGHFDGKRMFVPDNRETWYMPVPVSIGLLDPAPDVTKATVDIATYRATGSVRDDGTRVFRAS